MKDIVIFHLAKYAPLTPVRPYLHCAETLYEQIRKGDKTSEWRDFSKYWIQRLCWKQRAKNGKFGSINLFINGDQPQDLTFFLKVHKAWFVEGYPKGRLMMDLAKIEQEHGRH